MKIAAALPLYPPNSRVGAWLATHSLLAGMAARGHQVDVVTYLRGHMDNAYALDGVTVHPRCRIEQVAQDADVVVSHLGDNQEAAKWARFTGKPTVRMVHGHPQPGQVLDDSLAVFNSESLRAAVGWDGPSVVVHPPLDTEPVAPGTKVTLVNLTEAKGARLFWDLAATTRDVQFLAVQGGYGRQVLGKEKNVTILPATMHMAADVYSQTRVLLMPSEYETWGMVGMEAMASGIPVIAHPTPGLRESLGPAGIFVDRGDLAGWQQAIRTLAHQPNWDAASAAASARVAAFDNNTQIDRFAHALQALVPVHA